VAISGDYAIVGAFFEDHDIFEGLEGSAYIFKHNDGIWSRGTKSSGF
jgi:hypothetical protein